MFLLFSKPIFKHICICIKYLIFKTLLDLKYQPIYIHLYKNKYIYVLSLFIYDFLNIIFYYFLI